VRLRISAATLRRPAPSRVMCAKRSPGRRPRSRPRPARLPTSRRRRDPARWVRRDRVAALLLFRSTCTRA
jgi:hypothetical protein